MHGWRRRILQPIGNFPQNSTLTAHDSTPVVFTPNILVVDDDPSVRQEICASLEARSSYRCLPAAGTHEALALSRAYPVDVAVVDLAEPEFESLALARRLRREVADLAVVLVAGERNFDIAVEAMRVGVLDYLMRPFQMAEVVESVSRAVSWRLSVLTQRQERDELTRQVAERAQRIRQVLAESDLASTPAVDLFMATLFQRQPMPLGHARRVANFSVTLGTQLGVADPQIGVVQRAALMHDLGKIAVPDGILQKQGPLSDDEYAVMRSHVQIGHDIAATVPFLRPSADIMLATHERYDGNGYPNGLSGESIPLGARIIAVVDVFDALTSIRFTRDPHEVVAANTELVRGAGSQFDPDIVAAWLRCVDRTPGLTAAPREWAGILQ